MKPTIDAILEKCEFSDEKVWRDCGYDDEREPGVKQIVGGGKAVHATLMPIIRELCAIVEEQQKALELWTKPVPEVGECADQHEAINRVFNSVRLRQKETLDSTQKRLDKLASDKPESKEGE